MPGLQERFVELLVFSREHPQRDRRLRREESAADEVAASVVRIRTSSPLCRPRAARRARRLRKIQGWPARARFAPLRRDETDGGAVTARTIAQALKSDLRLAFGTVTLATEVTDTPALKALPNQAPIAEPARAANSRSATPSFAPLRDQRRAGAGRAKDALIELSLCALAAGGHRPPRGCARRRQDHVRPRAARPLARSHVRAHPVHQRSAARRHHRRLRLRPGPRDLHLQAWFSARSSRTLCSTDRMINQRTTPRTQSCLLEAMAEHQISVDGVARPLPPPFLVLATQSPSARARGHLSACPRSQLDRFDDAAVGGLSARGRRAGITPRRRDRSGARQAAIGRRRADRPPAAGGGSRGEGRAGDRRLRASCRWSPPLASIAARVAQRRLAPAARSPCSARAHKRALLRGRVDSSSPTTSKSSASPASRTGSSSLEAGKAAPPIASPPSGWSASWY